VCGSLTTRQCRQAGVDAALDQWWMSDAANRTGHNLLMAVHRYDLGSGTNEPGWTRPDTTILTPDAVPTIAVNDGTLGRFLSADGHEFLHALGIPHADQGRQVNTCLPAPPHTDFCGSHPDGSPDCGGGSGGQVGEVWTPDNRGRLQGMKYTRAVTLTAGRGLVDVGTPTLDTAAAPLYDLMSYCANGDRDAWLSPRNWNRAFSVLEAKQALLTESRSPDQSTAHAAGSGRAFVIGTVGRGSAHIERIVAANPGNASLPPDPSSALHVRSLDASGHTLSDAGAHIDTLHVDGAPGPGTFALSIPAGAATVELISGGTVLDRRARTRPPSVRVLGTRAGRNLSVSWAASDPDGDALQARLDYAANGSSGWRTVFQGPSTGRVTIPGRFLEAGPRARVRVFVNDGFNAATAQSGAFRMKGSPPTPRILNPLKGDALTTGNILLRGSALDDSLHRLSGKALTWFAGSRRLGSGSALRATLPAGVVRLRLRARDHLGRVAFAQRRVRIEPVPLQARVLRAPNHVRQGAGRVALTIATTTAAVLRVGGHSYQIGPRTRTVLVGLPARPKVGLLTIPLTIMGRGVSQRALHVSVVVLRS
jgi:hypothetical protein